MKEAAELFVPLERVIHHMATLRKSRGLFLLLCFCAHYVTWQSKRMDAFYGSETLAWYQTALTSVSPTTFWGLDTISGVKQFVEDHYRVTWALQEFCPRCEVAMLSTLQDMRHLGLDQGTSFLCSDFDKFVGEDDYTTRNCSVAKQEWDKSDWNASLRRNPPCCKDQGAGALAGLSLDLYREIIVPLEETGSMEMQVVVSRGQRMLGVLYSASQVNEYAPTGVVTTEDFWTYNYSDNENDYDTPKWWGLALLALVFVHEMFEASSVEEGVRAYVVSPLFILVELPSFLSPVLAEVLKYSIELKVWSLWITINEYIILIRLLEKGQVVPALRLIVQTLKIAMPDIFKLGVGIIPLLLLSTAAHTQLILSDLNFVEAFINTMRILTSPPAYSQLDLEKNYVAANLLFHLDNVSVRLVSGSFVTAILVRSFNKASITLEQEQKTQLALSPAWKDHGKDADSIFISKVVHAIDGLQYFFTGWYCSAWEHVVEAALKSAQGNREQFDLALVEESDLKHFTMVSALQLRKITGSQQVADALVARFGVVAVGGELEAGTMGTARVELPKRGKVVVEAVALSRKCTRRFSGMPASTAV